MAAGKIGFAVLGLGKMGRTHVNNLMRSSRGVVRAVMINNVKAASRRLEVYDSPPQCFTPAQYQDILDDQTIGGVVVCSPTSQHEGQVKAALKAGKAVFCEKPVTSEIETTRSCYELAESVGKPLFCAFHRRFDPSFMTVKEQLTSNASGRLRLIRSSSHDESAPPVSYIRNSGGIIKDSTIHDLDMVLWLTGSPAKRVFAQGHAFDPDIQGCGDLDLVLVVIEHVSGAQSVIDNGRRCAYGYDQRLEAICDNGSYVVTNRNTTECHHHAASGSTRPGIDKSFETRYVQAYHNEMEHFLDILSDGCPSKVTKSDILSVMNLAEAATKSARSGCPVDLN